MLKKRYQEWNYWRQFGPEYSITSTFPVVVKPSYTPRLRYEISLNIRLRCRNRDNLNLMRLECRNMNITIIPQNSRMRTIPLMRYEDEINWFLVTNEPIENDYILKAYQDIKPILGDIVRCEKIYLGIVELNQITRTLTARPFLTTVEWPKIEKPEFDKEGSQT